MVGFDDVNKLILVRLGHGKADTVVAQIELCVEPTNEDVSDDPQWAGRRGDIEPEETAETDCLSHLLYLRRSMKNMSQGHLKDLINTMVCDT